MDQKVEEDKDERERIAIILENYFALFRRTCKNLQLRISQQILIPENSRFFSLIFSLASGFSQVSITKVLIDSSVFSSF